MSGELYNVRKIMLRGTELSKMDSDVLSNYDDKKTVLSSYLVKKLISQSAAKSTEFDNSITSEQEMWQIKTTTKEKITETSVFQQEEGVKMYPIKLTSGNVEDALKDVAMSDVIMYKKERMGTYDRKPWKFEDVKDFYSSVYPNQFGENGTVEKLGLMVVDFSVMDLQQLSEIHIPKLIKIDIPNDANYYDSHWFIPVAIKTPVINKSILIDAPSAIIINPQQTDGHYVSGVDNINFSHYPSDEEATDLTTSYEYILEVGKGIITESQTIGENITIDSYEGYNSIGIDFTDTNHPIIKLSDTTNVKETITVSEVTYTFESKSITLKTVHTDKYLFALDKKLIKTFKKVTGATAVIADGTSLSGTFDIGLYEDKIAVYTKDQPDSINELYYKVQYTLEGETHVLESNYSSHIYDSIDVKIRVSQFACGKDQELTANVPTKLYVETINGYAIPSAFIAKYGDNILTCAYSDNIANNFYSLNAPAYYHTVAFQKLKIFKNSNKHMIMYDKACVIVPKDAEIDFDYTEMYAPNCSFNIIVLEPSYLLKMKGTLSKPIDRQRYLNMEDYLMELPYRHYNNMLMNTLFTRSYENYDQTYKLVVDKYDDGTFVYADGVIPLSSTTSTGDKKSVDKYFIASKLVDENQNVWKMGDKKMTVSGGVTSWETYHTRIGVETTKENGKVKPVHINMTDLQRGLDIFGTTEEAEVEVELPILDLSNSSMSILRQKETAPNGMTLLTADKITIHANNFINDYNTDTKFGDVEVNENGRITKVPEHICSDEDNTPIKAVLKIDETAIGPELQINEVRTKMCQTVVDSPITLYTLGEAGWTSEGLYANLSDGTTLTRNPVNMFTKVLVPKKGLEQPGYKSDWLIAYAKMLRLILPGGMFAHLNAVPLEAQTQIDDVDIPATVNDPPSQGSTAATSIFYDLYNQCNRDLLITGTARKISALKTEVEQSWPDDQITIFNTIYNDKIVQAEREFRDKYATEDKLTDIIDFY